MALSNTEKQKRHRKKKMAEFEELKRKVKRMQLKVFGIYDSKAEAYLQPFLMKSKGEAIRALSNHVSDPEHNFCKYAEDFTLFELGSWDDANGQFTLHNTPQSLGVLVEFKRTQ